MPPTVRTNLAWALLSWAYEQLEFGERPRAQAVRDLAGVSLSEQIVEHVYEMKDGLVRRMEIRPDGGSVRDEQ
jgi:hypothetical protein